VSREYRTTTKGIVHRFLLTNGSRQRNDTSLSRKAESHVLDHIPWRKHRGIS